MRLGLTGDVMLGRLVDTRVLAHPEKDPGEVWGDTRSLLSAVDARFINLECVIAASGHPRPGKVFCFRARPRAIDALKAARVNFVGLANNHVLDYGPEALRECLGLLRGSGIAFAGAGMNLEEAAAPAVIPLDGMTVGIVAITDNEPAWEAGENEPGVNFVAYDARGLLRLYRERVERAIGVARAAAEFVMVCAHVGPNWGAPGPALRTLAAQVLDLGADLWWGHSNHSVQGVELRGGKAVFYSAGDFLDDYAVDPDERNDLSFFAEVEVCGGQVQRLRLHPVRIEDLCVHRAGAGDAAWLRRRLEGRSAVFGTHVGERTGAVIVPPL